MDKRNINQVRNEAWSTYKDVTRTSDTWKQFTLSGAYNYKYNLEDRLQLYKYNKDGKAFADVSIWNRAFKRRVNSDAQAIPIIDNSGENPKIKYVFERSDTTGEKNVNLYRLSDKGKFAYTNLINLPDDRKNRTFEELFYSNVYNDVLKIAEKQFDEDNLFYDKESYTKLIAHTVSLATIERLELNSGIYNPDLSYISEIDYIHAQKGINEAYQYIDQLIVNIRAEELRIERGNDYEDRSTSFIRDVGERETQIPNESSTEVIQGTDSRRGRDISEIPGRTSGRSRPDGHQHDKEAESEIRSDNRPSEQSVYGVRTDNEQDNLRDSRSNTSNIDISRDGEIENKEAVDPNIIEDGKTASFNLQNDVSSNELSRDITEIYLDDIVVVGSGEYYGFITKEEFETAEPVTNSVNNNNFYVDGNKRNYEYYELESYDECYRLVNNSIVLPFEGDLLNGTVTDTLQLIRVEAEPYMNPDLKNRINERSEDNINSPVNPVDVNITNHILETYIPFAHEEWNISPNGLKNYLNNPEGEKYISNLYEMISSRIKEIANNTNLPFAGDEEMYIADAVTVPIVELRGDDAKGLLSDSYQVGESRTIDELDNIAKDIFGAIKLDLEKTIHEYVWIKDNSLKSKEEQIDGRINRQGNENERRQGGSDIEENNREEESDSPEITSNRENEEENEALTVPSESNKEYEIPYMLDILDSKIDDISVSDEEIQAVDSLDQLNILENDLRAKLNEVIDIEEKAIDIKHELSEYKLKKSYIGSAKDEPDEYGYKATNKVANREVRKFGRHLAKSIGYELDEKRTSVNYGSGTILLWKPESKYGVYLSLDFDKIPTSTAPYHDEYVLRDKIMYRATTKDKWTTGFHNNWLHVEDELKVSDLVEIIPQLVDRQERRDKADKEVEEIKVIESDKIESNLIAIAESRDSRNFMLVDESSLNDIKINKSNLHVNVGDGIIPLHVISEHTDIPQLNTMMASRDHELLSLTDHVSHIVPVYEKEFKDVFEELEGFSLSAREIDNSSEIEPYVYIKWSENPLINRLIPEDSKGIKMSFALANKMLQRVNDIQHVQRGLSDEFGYYDKTRIQVRSVRDGNEYVFGERFDIGDGAFDVKKYIGDSIDYKLKNGNNTELYNVMKDNMLPDLSYYSELNDSETKFYNEFNKSVLEHYKIDPDLDDLYNTYNDYCAEEFMNEPMTYLEFMTSRDIGIAHTEIEDDDNNEYSIQVSYDFNKQLEITELSNELLTVKKEEFVTLNQMSEDIKSHTFDDFINEDGTGIYFHDLNEIVDLHKQGKVDEINKIVEGQNIKVKFNDGTYYGLLESEKSEIVGDREIAVRNGDSFTFITKDDTKNINLSSSELYVEVNREEYPLLEGVSIDDKVKVDNLFNKYGWKPIDSNLTEASNKRLEVSKNDDIASNNQKTILDKPVEQPTLSVQEGFKITDMELGEYTPKERLRKNIEAITLLRDLETDHRQATPEEKITLSEYSGFGGIPEVFDETNNSWANEYKELKGILSDEEYISARASTLNAHFTSPVVIEEMYKTLNEMGFSKGRALEPAAGTGNFIGMLPSEMDVKFTGIELDDLTGRIAKNIYDKSEIIVGGFEDYNASDNTFDFAVGNVPFGSYKLNDSRYDNHGFVIHDYFFAKSLDKVKPKGVVAFITSSGTMDKQSTKFREYIAERADLLGAVRLPNTAFKDNANTEVTTDIIFLQKRDELRSLRNDRPAWVDTSSFYGHSVNNYFIQNKNAVVGEMKEVSGRFGNEIACILDDPTQFKEKLSEALKTVNTVIAIPETSIEEQSTEAKLDVVAPSELRPYSYFMQDGEIYFKKESSFDVELINESGKRRERIEGLIEIRDNLRQLIDMQSQDYSDEDIRAFQAKFNKLYDDYVSENGYINRVKDENGKYVTANTLAFSRDVSYPLLCSLENLDSEEMFKSKADIFSKRTITRHIAPSFAQNGYEALTISLNEKGKVDLDYMSQLTNKSKADLVSELDGVIYRDNMETSRLNIEGSKEKLENAVFVTADEFLSGNIREKLELEKMLHDYSTSNVSEEIIKDMEKNIRALEATMPEPLTASEIAVSMSAPWIEPSDVRNFALELLDLPDYRDFIEFDRCDLNGKYNISNKRGYSGVRMESTFGTKRMNALQIIEETLNSKTCIVRDKIEEDGKIKYVVNDKETLLAQEKQELIKDKFESWIWNDYNRRERLEKRYNEMFNSTVARHYDGDHLEFPYMSKDINLQKHQKDGIARGLYGGNSLLAHTVGAGKTFTLAAIAMESKRIGLANKSLFVVPNHLTEQWGSEILKLYPTANILVATKDDFTPAKRQEFISKIAVGSYDGIVIGHSQFNKIPLSKERQELVMRTEIDNVTKQIQELKYQDGKKFTVKQLELKKNELKSKLTKLLNEDWKDNIIDFESLGVDRLFVDESDVFKNLDTYTQMQNVAGLNTKGSLQAFDMYAKVQYMNEITGNKGTFYATGTPISNSIVEMYTNQRTLQPERLQELGVQNFDQWASVFAKTTTSLELKPEGGGYQLKTRLSGYKNIPELKNIFNEVADIKTSDMLNLNVPEVEYKTVVSERSEFQADYIKTLGERADQVRANSVDRSVDNMLKITNDGRNLALDQRMINPILPDEENSKVNKCVDNVYDIWDKTKHNKSTQLIFSDIATPSTNKSVERYCVYDDIKEKLIKKGIPENEIKFIHDAKTDKQKVDLFKEVRTGKVRVLIGSTEKMGAGTNVQDKLIASHHLDCPWRPRDLEQRDGRIIRQGNENAKVEIYRYVTKDTFDTYNYQLIEAKQKFIGSIMTSDSPLREINDIDDMVMNYAAVKALTVGDPNIKEKMELDIDVAKLKTMRSSFLSNKYELENNIMKVYPQRIERYENMIKNTEKDMDTLSTNTKVNHTGKSIFTGMEIDGKLFNDKSEAGEAFKKIIPKCTTSTPKVIGKYKGFDVAINFNSFTKNYNGHIKGNETYEFELGTNASGNMQRLDNAFEKIKVKNENAINRLADAKSDLENAKIEVKKDFPHENELQTKIKRLKEIEGLIDRNSKSKEKPSVEHDR